ncbi:MAG: hypothetical protein ACRENU_15570 [Gemmatimonadaceae bacterium]
MTDLETLWLATLQEVVGRAAHEVKDALNGVHLNLEAIRSRTAKQGSGADVTKFAASAADQLEAVTARTEAVLFLARPVRDGGAATDLALTLRHLGTLLVPAAKSDGGSIALEGQELPVATAAPAVATRLALAAGLLAMCRQGGHGRCALEVANPGDSASETVVRFSHESADSCTIEPAVATALEKHHIRMERSGSDLLLIFPGT